MKENSLRLANGISQSHRFTQTGEDLGGNLQNLNFHKSLEEHASASFKRNFFNDESQEVKEASDRPLEA
ncbi:hypothetical protein CFP56_039315 [Quercus suber]|uniref:Uncharacterized protein n=1 Tax=Quercus suber TaxID=58331 RepID=A0AAW0J0T1_QUESU